MSVKLCFIDIETAPSLGWVWGKWEQDVIDFEEDWYMLSFAVKWDKGKKVKTFALPDFPSYKKDKTNDKNLVTELWKIFNEADVIVAHNGDDFDIKKSNARFITHGLKPPSPFKTIDTLKVARKYFAFTSNKLDDVCRDLKIGRKVPHTGFNLWKGCMNGNPEAWKKMREYNAADVLLLESLYRRLRAWDNKGRVDLNIFTDKPESCPFCLNEHVQKKGFHTVKGGKKPRYQCQSCGGWWIGKLIKNEKV